MSAASGGSSPTAAYANKSVLSDIRPGVYVFNDAQQFELGVCALEDIALTVVSKSDGRLILDSGTKTLSADRLAWSTGYGRLVEYPEARIVAASEHHATVELPGALPALGSRVLVAPNHVCRAVNLLLPGERVGYRLNRAGLFDRGRAVKQILVRQVDPSGAGVVG